jgi:lysozyme
MRIRWLVALLVAICAGGCALYYFGYWIPNWPPVSKYPVRGVDVAHHQRDIDWAKVARAGQKFAYIKATEGADFRDNKFTQNWAGARAAGMIPGAYHFFTLGTSGARQAEIFVSTVPREANSLPPAIDLEFSGYNRSHPQPPNEFRQELAKFTEIITAFYGRPPVIYTMDDFQSQYLNGMRLKNVWVREIFFRPKGSDWTFWQFNSRGHVPGIHGYADLNVFCGTAADFQVMVRPR